MVDAESTQGNDGLAVAPAAPIPDWSNVRGFQVLAAAGSEPDASAADPNDSKVGAGRDSASALSGAALSGGAGSTGPSIRSGPRDVW